MNIVRRFSTTCVCLCVVIGLTSCLAVTTGGEGTDSQKVKTNADLAIAKCGAGNVKSVTTQGFECKQ